ncbi:hypothetical protein LOTGIDRAFT_153277 [Lottia gigantea]|uniref:Sushi domain-containing protein n=1 Tax=Lottia gigantea TaxID=225164 RepID=V4AAK7_LOTGI|nr:hypothetical protein LOTGIDRAFT_153277 [Lottia gigantea]ESO93807.1 hypothetical protein LOTGIDRAFT_153277 [Lottia gigantea]
MVFASSHLPGTAKECGPLPQGNSSKGTVNGSTLFPNTASYTCDEGHEPVSGEPEISCLASGKWETDVLVCQLTKDCGSEPLDLVSVVDGSSSVNSESYDKMIDEIADFNSISLNVNSMTVNVGLVNSDGNFDFSSDVIILSSDSNQVLGKIRALKHQGGSLDYAFSINTAKNSIFDDFRPEVQDVIILLSAGVSSVNPQSKASDAKGAGIKIFTIGIGDSVDRGELKGIASDPTEAKFINFFSDIRATLHDLVNDFC